MTPPEAQAYRNGRDDMKERILEKLNEELSYMTGMEDSENMTKLMHHLIGRITKLS